MYSLFIIFSFLTIFPLKASLIDTSYNLVPYKQNYPVPTYQLPTDNFLYTFEDLTSEVKITATPYQLPVFDAFINKLREPSFTFDFES
jgi:hypothetical protein